MHIETRPHIMCNPIVVICSDTPTVTDPITKMELAHTEGHCVISGVKLYKDTGICPCLVLAITVKSPCINACL